MDTSKATDGTIIDQALQKEILNNPFARLEQRVGKEIAKADDYKPNIARLLKFRKENENDYELNANLRKRFRQEKKVRIQRDSDSNHKLGELAVLNKKDILEAKMADFDRNKAKEDIRLKKDMILTTSIFGREREDKKIVELKKKLANMPRDTLNALKIG